MNKNDIYSFPENIDMANPYLFDSIYVPTQMLKVAYTQGMTLNAGEYCYDTDEKAYWIKPALTGSNYRVGYIKIESKTKLKILPTDKITAEFEIKSSNTIAESQKIGVHVDVKDSVDAVKGTITFLGDIGNDYTYNKITKIVDPNLTTVKYHNFVIGVITSSNATEYEFRIRNINITVEHNKMEW